MTQVLLDTNVLLRLANATASEHVSVRDGIAALIAKAAEPVICPQVLVELWVVATRPADVNGFGWSPELVRRAVDGLCAWYTVLPEGPDVFEEWRKVVYAGVSGKRAHDARIAALMRARSVKWIFTLNAADFAGFDGVAALHPRDVGGWSP